ncbi:unnamed protein product [Thelazia callipaeda]|uniref:DUF4283 domain protein n=1 Tax=Thelazia callipaeda TaxID=103827 RepID=A0A0N5CT02_THECL|nr:unnamed protein product [Thelazia callipaeda]
MNLRRTQKVLRGVAHGRGRVVNTWSGLRLTNLRVELPVLQRLCFSLLQGSTLRIWTISKFRVTNRAGYHSESDHASASENQVPPPFDQYCLSASNTLSKGQRVEISRLRVMADASWEIQEDRFDDLDSDIDCKSNYGDDVYIDEHEMVVPKNIAELEEVDCVQPRLSTIVEESNIVAEGNENSKAEEFSDPVFGSGLRGELGTEKVLGTHSIFQAAGEYG